MTAEGATYSETLFDIGAPSPNDARIVFLRPDQRYDDASLNRMVLRIDDQDHWQAGLRRFPRRDVPDGKVILEISADNRFFGTCKLALVDRGGRYAVLRCQGPPVQYRRGHHRCPGRRSRRRQCFACRSGHRFCRRRHGRLGCRKRGQDLRRPVSLDATRTPGRTGTSRSPPRVRVAGRRPLYLAVVFCPAIHGQTSRKIPAADVPGPDPCAAAILGGRGMRSAAALRHGSRRRHFPHRRLSCARSARSPGMPRTCSRAGGLRTADMATTRSGSSITTSSRS